MAVPSLFIYTCFNPELYNCFPSSCLLPCLSPLTHLPQIILVAQLTLFKNFSVSFSGPGVDEISENSPSLESRAYLFLISPQYFTSIFTYLFKSPAGVWIFKPSSLKPAPKAGVFKFYSLWLAVTSNTSSPIPCVGHNTIFLVALAPQKYQVLPQLKIFIFYLKLAFVLRLSESGVIVTRSFLSTPVLSCSC